MMVVLTKICLFPFKQGLMDSFWKLNLEIMLPFYSCLQEQISLCWSEVTSWLARSLSSPIGSTSTKRVSQVRACNMQYFRCRIR